jgi:hypothetical protein
VSDQLWTYGSVGKKISVELINVCNTHFLIKMEITCVQDPKSSP